MNERALANRLRIAIIEDIVKIDLPAFLFEQIDKNLLELNYFKLSNLHNNLGTYKTYLEEIQSAYVDFVKRHNPLMRRKWLAPEIYESYMTDSLYDQEYQMAFSKTELIKLESMFSVSCILKMKEFINRRILNKQVEKVARKKSSS